MMWRLRGRASDRNAVKADTPHPVEAPLASGASLWWGREQFQSLEPGAGHNHECPAVIDLTGPQRTLLWGPYAVLEAGLWRATALIDLCPDAAKRVLAFQFGIEPDYTTADLTREVAGRHAVVIEHHMPGDGLTTLRLWLKKPAFHGEVRFLGAIVERLGDT
jgi:hypothetical protein